MSGWDNTIKYLEEKVSGFSVENKEGVWHQKLIAALLWFAPYERMWAAIYPKVWKPKDRKSVSTLQHEGVHLMDAQTFYDILPVKMKILNLCLFVLAYGFPQIFALLALLALGGNLWWLMALLCLLPLPAPGRMIAEMRAYRRSVEMGRDPKTIVDNFVGKKYYFMWPFPSMVRKMLKRPSPYKEEMDTLL